MTEPKMYLINYNKVLGYGKSAAVYLGIKSSDGIECAFKCSSNQLVNEVAIMQELKHVNIIKFYDNLDHFDHFRSVIVMEYCNRGSLFDFTTLHNGLCDNMFLRVLECLHQGICYLRGKCTVHRDIKPGNMMVHQDTLGDFHVKLGDLGTAKKVEDGGRYNTMCGTEAYLHPDLFIDHLEGLGGQFKASTDLWSTGVTLYHAAITELPFTVFRNIDSYESKQMLKDMYSMKQPGVISGRQNSDAKDDITWSYELPDKCQLSPMLKDLAAKLIGNLMDLTEANTYERFFEEANRVCQKKRVQIFNSLSGVLEILYLDSLTYGNVSDQISRSVGHPKEDLILLTNDKRLHSPAEVDTQCLRSMPVHGHLRYSLTSNTVLIVINKPLSDSPPFVSRQLPLRDCAVPKDMYRDLDKAKAYSDQVMTSLYEVSHSANYIDCQIECYLATSKAFTKSVLDVGHQLLSESLPWQMKNIKDSCLMSSSLINNSKEVLDLAGQSNDLVTRLNCCEEEITKLRTISGENEAQWHVIVGRVRDLVTLLSEMERSVYSEDNTTVYSSLDSLVCSAEFLVNEMKMLPPEKVGKDITVYKLEVWRRHIQLYDCYQLSRDIFQSKSSQIIDMQQRFLKWLKPALDDLRDISALRESLSQNEETRLYIRNKFMEIYDAILQMLLKLELGNKISELPALNIVDNETFKTRLFEIKEIIDKMTNARFVSRSK